MLSSLVCRVLAFTGLVALAVAVLPAAASAQPAAGPADARLRALYTEEWNWRRQELGRRSDQPGEAGAADRLPRVDAASQQARLTYGGVNPPATSQPGPSATTTPTAAPAGRPHEPNR